MCLLYARGENPVEIPRKNIYLHIELSFALASPEGSLACGVGNDVYGESRFIAPGANIVDGERDAVERDRALLRDHRREFSRYAELEAQRVPLLARGSGSRDPVDMAGDNMAAELVAHAQGALEVQLRALAPQVRGGARHCSRGDRHRE